MISVRSHGPYGENSPVPTNGSPMRCAMTGLEIRETGDGIWDDGEWISWAWINTQIEPLEDCDREDDEETDENEEDEAPEPSVDLLFRILAAKNHYQNTLDEISPDWGSIGETYLAEGFGVKLCSRHTEGHDGRLGDDLIEIKTITPHKSRPVVSVKRSGNFNMLAVVRIRNDSEVAVRFVRRERLPPGNGGKRIVVTWKTLCRLGKKHPPRDRG